jgi:hypothetical protein
MHALSANDDALRARHLPAFPSSCVAGQGKVPRDLCLDAKDVDNIRQKLQRQQHNRHANEAESLSNLIDQFADNIFLRQDQRTEGEGDRLKARAGASLVPAACRTKLLSSGGQPSEI